MCSRYGVHKEKVFIPRQSHVIAHDTYPFTKLSSNAVSFPEAARSAGMLCHTPFGPAAGTLEELKKLMTPKTHIHTYTWNVRGIRTNKKRQNKCWIGEICWRWISQGRQREITWFRLQIGTLAVCCVTNKPIESCRRTHVRVKHCEYAESVVLSCVITKGWQEKGGC